MRIFMLVQHPGARGPIAKHTSHLISALRSGGCSVETHAWGRRRDDESLFEKLVERFQDVLSVRRALDGKEFDVAVVKTAHDWRTLLRDIAVVLVIRRRCRPLVLQFHGSLASRLVEPGRPLFKLATTLLLGVVDGVMVLSTEEQRQWQQFRRRPPVFTVKNPYVSPLGDERPSARTPPARHRLLFVGRLIQEKGIFEIVEALAGVLKQTDCDLVLVGAGDQERALRAEINDLELDDHVVLPGYLTGQELIECYQAATAFVFPSWNEGFPTVLAEAMDAGLPIITTRIRGAADHLVEGENALFVEPRDVKGLTSAIAGLLRDDDLRARMSDANRERIRIFAPEVVAAEYLAALESVVHSSREMHLSQEASSVP
jgi:glycosyltransferase involved in cell wall biosynthesis